jgi:Rho GDP-dissociation inhibitor
VIIEPTDPSRLILKRLVLVPDGHAEIAFNLTGNLEKLKEQIITLKEGSSYRIKVEFYVQRDIISGLRFAQNAYKGPIRTDKSLYMIGSRAPKGELQEYLSEKELTPSGN